jgi:hypothetical protein
MKKILTLLAFIAGIGYANAQSSTTTTTPEPEKTEAVEQKAHSCAGHGEAKAAKGACCAGHGAEKASAETGTDVKAAGCCAGKAKGASCHGAAKAEAGDVHGEAHGELKEHTCTEACKDGAHTYTCGEKGHACSEACHAKM